MNTHCSNCGKRLNTSSATEKLCQKCKNEKVIDLDYCKVMFANRTAMSMEYIEDIQEAGNWLIKQIEKWKREYHKIDPAGFLFIED